MRWLRLYTDVINDAKIAKLSDSLHRFWIGTLCIARRHEHGFLPAADQIAFHLRITERKAKANLQALVDATLIDETAGGLRPHDWDEWQPPSDSSAARMRRHRNRHRDGAGDVTDTAPEEEGELEEEQNRPEQRQTATSPTVPLAIVRLTKETLPTEFKLGPDRLDYALGKGLSAEETTTAFSKFANYHRFEGTRSANWDAAWQLWVDREHEFKGRKQIDRETADGRI